MMIAPGSYLHDRIPGQTTAAGSWAFRSVRISDLTRGKIEHSPLDTLVNMLTSASPKVDSPPGRRLSEAA
jgi:predicted XRE-type DNA-binding protein